MICSPSPSVKVLPTLTGRWPNTVEGSVRCRPSMRISWMVNGAAASAQEDNPAANKEKVSLFSFMLYPNKRVISLKKASSISISIRERPRRNPHICTLVLTGLPRIHSAA